MKREHQKKLKTKRLRRDKMKEQLVSIQENGGELKENLWAWLDGSRIPLESAARVKDAMNELLDELDYLYDSVVGQT